MERASDPGEQTDAEAIAHSLRDPADFVVVFHRHYDTVYRILAGRFGREVAEELAAETFTRAFAQRNRFDSEYASALPWLIGIALNLGRTHVRSETRRWRAYARAWGERDEQAGLPAQAMLDDADKRAVAAAFAQLAPIDRDVLGMYAVAELTYEEIAESLEIPVGTVRSRLNRARKRLRDSLRVEHSAGRASTSVLLPTAGGVA